VVTKDWCEDDDDPLAAMMGTARWHRPRAHQCWQPMAVEPSQDVLEADDNWEMTDGDKADGSTGSDREPMETSDRGDAEGKEEPTAAVRTDHSGVEPKVGGAKAEPTGRQAEMELRDQRPEVEPHRHSMKSL